MKRKHSRLASKFVIGFEMLGILICVVSSAIGLHQFKARIEKQYNDTAYDIASVAQSYIEIEKLKEYTDAAIAYNNGEISEEQIEQYRMEDTYQEVKEKLVTLREKMGANDIFIVYLDQEIINTYDSGWTEEQLEQWKPMVYVFDAYRNANECFQLGETGRFNPEFIEDTVEMFETGERPDNYFISKSTFGYNTSAMLPVVYDGKVIAAIGVEVPMKQIRSVLEQYLLYAVGVTALLIIMVISVYMIYLYRSVIRPINRLTKETGEFTKNETTISKSLEKIKTRDEIEDLAQSIIKMETDIKDYIENLTRVTAEKERIGAELDVATNIQASMLPCIFPAFPEREEFDVYATMTPAKEVGGDFYDFFMVDDRHIAIVMADVSGKGVPAALFMVIGKTLIKDHTLLKKGLGDVFTDVNNLLCEANSEGLFITAFEGVLDLVTGEFVFVNAGHEMPFICKKNGEYAPYKIRPGFVLAGMEGMKYKAGSIQLDEGDKLFQYTDGVTEATDAENQLYGMDRLQKILNQCKNFTPHETLVAVKEDVDGFVKDAPQFDDITMLCLEYKKKMEGSTDA